MCLLCTVCVQSLPSVYNVYAVGRGRMMCVQRTHVCDGTVQCVYSLYTLCTRCTLEVQHVESREFQITVYDER